MDINNKLSAAESAEEFFTILGVPFDPHTLAPVRLLVMKRFGEYKKAIDHQNADVDGQRQVNLYANALVRSYREVRNGIGALQRHLKVSRGAGCACSGGCSTSNNDGVDSVNPCNGAGG